MPVVFVDVDDVMSVVVYQSSRSKDADPDPVECDARKTLWRDFLVIQSVL